MVPVAGCVCLSLGATGLTSSITGQNSGKFPCQRERAREAGLMLLICHLHLAGRDSLPG